jgi:hypothetical protein
MLTFQILGASVAAATLLRLLDLHSAVTSPSMQEIRVSLRQTDA